MAGLPLHALSWVEISAAALQHNVASFRALAGDTRALMVVVKANAYGHGAVEVARLALDAGARWLAVFHVDEAFALRDAGIDAPVLVLGPTPLAALPRAAAEGIRPTVAGPEAAAQLGAGAPPELKLHLKLETGTHRQGFLADQLDSAVALQRAGLAIEGVYTHFADIEDTTDHTYAMGQLAAFRSLLDDLADRGLRPPLRHSACSAATLLFPETYFDLVRVGISAYGLWPSRETLVSVKQRGRDPVELQPVMAWKTRIAQVKAVPAGASVAYGRTYQTTRPSRLAVLPVGYANGYDRALSNRAHVLVRGQIARLAGRVMMNMIVVDVSDIPGAAAGDEVVLLGRQGTHEVSADQLASWMGTINYEVVTRIEPHGPRLRVP